MPPCRNAFAFAFTVVAVWLGATSASAQTAAINPALAQVIAGFRGVDTPKSAELMTKLEALAQPERPFHASVMELQALIAQRKGDLKRARELWGEIAKDPAAAQGSVQRAQALLNYYGAAPDAAGTK